MYKFKFADVGEGIHEGVVYEWYVKEGDTVDEGQDLYSVETDKFTTDIPSPVAGKIVKIYFEAGSEINVGDLMVDIDDGSGAESEDTAAPKVIEEKTEKKEEKAGTKTASVVGTIEASDDIIESYHVQKEEKKEKGKKALATPVARNFAKINGVDINAVTGTGTNGRVTKEDISNYMNQNSAKNEAPQAKSESTSSSSDKVEIIKMSKMRETISKKMTQSKFTIPHTSAMFEFDVTEIFELRKEVNADLKDREIKLSFMPFIVKALVAALKKYPIMNSELDEEKREIIIKHFFNISIAVDTEHGLAVPVLKDADQMTLLEIHENINKLASQASDRTLPLDSMTGGTFSITNYGSIGGTFATPVINYPEAAILGIGAISKRPVYDENDRIVPRYIMPTVLSFDHRIMDGGDANRFMAEFGKIISSKTNILIN